MRKLGLLPILLILHTAALSQGRVVVNEYMGWSGCNTTSEFIELLNFGPGPMDIGCFVVTNGQYAVTIPPNTVLQPGKYFVLSGQNTLAAGCANTDSAVAVNLNWNTCNCTNQPIPTTGDGFLKNGGSANEKIVLMNAAGNVVDAVSRSTPTASAQITTSTVAAGCSPKTFDLDALAISYELIGISTGIDNSYSRRVDGDCGWVKTTAISAAAPNKTGNTGSANYSFTTLDASQCNGTTGSISIHVNAADLQSLFPMTYVLAFDQNRNNSFEDTDTYIYGTDNTAPSIDIDNLAYGRYRITVGSSMGCNLQSFDFFIFNCYGLVLPYRVLSFSYDTDKLEKRWFKTSLTGLDSLKSIVIEANSGGGFTPVNTFLPSACKEGQEFNVWAPISHSYQYRVRLISKSNIDYYSPVITIRGEVPVPMHIWPNPSPGRSFVNIVSTRSGRYSYRIISALGQTIIENHVALTTGKNVISINTATLKPGIYRLAVEGESALYPLTQMFIKE